MMLLFISCNSHEMDGIEKQISSKLEAESVELYHQASRKTTNGISSGTRSYLELDVYDSKILASVKDNELLLNEKCNEIKNIILNLPTLSLYPRFTQIRIGIIETHGFLIFKSKTSNILTYDIR